MRIIEEKVLFKSGQVNIAGNLCYLDNVSDQPVVLFLYGGGSANKECFVPWQGYFAKNGLASMSIDFTGKGESGGSFEEGTLKKRALDAKMAVRFLFDRPQFQTKRLGVLASSMGGHVACRLVGLCPNIKAVFLYAPAAYSDRAEGIRLNEEFGKILREEGSWRDSSVFESLKNYGGHLVVAYSVTDEVIPLEVQAKYKSLIREKGGSVIDITGVNHKLLAPQDSEAEIARRKIYRYSFNFFSAYL